MCDVSTCCCAGRYGLPYDAQGLLQVDLASSLSPPVYECNRACTCPVDCPTRVVQRGVTCRLQVYNTHNKGYGVRTLDALSRNTFVCEYAGEVLTPQSARSRLQRLTPGDNNYVLAVNEHLSERTITTYIDPTYIGNVGRFLNHSCQPNLYMVPVRVDHDIPRLALFTTRDIDPMQELCYSYAGLAKDNTGDVMKQANGTAPDGGGGMKQVNGKCVLEQRKPCHCGSDGCTGLLPYDDTIFSNK